jgi:hypothetical protein
MYIHKRSGIKFLNRALKLEDNINQKPIPHHRFLLYDNHRFLIWQQLLNSHFKVQISTWVSALSWNSWKECICICEPQMPWSAYAHTTYIHICRCEFKPADENFSMVIKTDYSIVKYGDQTNGPELYVCIYTMEHIKHTLQSIPLICPYCVGQKVVDITIFLNSFFCKSKGIVWGASLPWISNSVRNLF